VTGLRDVSPLGIGVELAKEEAVVVVGRGGGGGGQLPLRRMHTIASEPHQHMFATSKSRSCCTLFPNRRHLACIKGNKPSSYNDLLVDKDEAHARTAMLSIF
jgi:hypothetical protein